MCIICVSPRSVRQPSEATIRAMFARNPHGAGYMVARDGRVRISKGYMSVDGLLAALRQEHFTAKDPVVYHFRISTQAGVSPYMTHPASSGAILANVYFQLVGDNVEVSWNNEDAEDEVRFYSLSGGAKVQKTFFVNVVDEFLKNYALHWFA